MSARFAPGDLVRVDDRDHEGHCRTPLYVRGKVGRVDAVAGSFRDPEQLAYYRPGTPPLPLYIVRFRQADVWPGYAGAPNDTVTADIYEHWLLPADKEAS